MNTAVPPCRVLGSETDNQLAQLQRCWWSARTGGLGLGPVSGDSAPVPAQQRLGCHDPAMTQPARECGCDRAKHCAIVVVDGRPVHLASQNLELVAQHDDLEVFRASGTNGQPSQSGHEAVKEARHDRPGWRHRPCSAPTRDFPSPTTHRHVLLDHRRCVRLS